MPGFLKRLSRPTISIPLTLAALTLAFFHKLAFTGMILGRGDMYAYFYPYWTVRNMALMGGRIPLWTPDIFMGAPLLANSQMGLFYPFNWPLVPLDAPTGITISLLLHILWAMGGMYVLARRTVGLGRVPALVSAVLFGMGGYVGAKVENINQLQALAWMPWLFWLVGKAIVTFPPEAKAIWLPEKTSPLKGLKSNAKSPITLYPNHDSTANRLKFQPRYVLLLGVVLAVQLLAGHPQTVFITGLGLGIYGAVSCFQLSVVGSKSEKFKARLMALVRAGVVLGVAGVVGVVLALPQLLPMMELSGTSNRSGGLNPQQAMAFSLNPFVIGRGMLPSYDGLLFGEYIGYIGVIGLALAVVGMLNRTSPSTSFRSGEGEETSPPAPLAIVWRGGSQRLPWIVLAVLGFGLALGLYNPLYWTLASLPGFSFFRVPARWLALFALGAAMLAGIGLQSLTVKRPAWWILVIIVGLVGGLAGATTVTGQMAMDVIGPAEPTAATWVGWGVALAVVMVGLIFYPLPPHRPIGRLRTSGREETSPPAPLHTMERGAKTMGAARWIVPVLAVAAVVEVFAASRVLAYNALVPPDTYTARRFTIPQLQAYQAEQIPPGRALGISQMQFDPGDADALIARYRSLGMSDLAIRIGLVDTKMRELVAPNLSLQWGIPSIDGFDGGLLPTGYYTAFTSLMIPPGELRTTDGRLREILAREECRGACIPDMRWLNLTNTRYLMTDKVFDVWHEGVAYDTQLPTSGGNDVYRNPTGFEATAIDILYVGGEPPRVDAIDQSPPITQVTDFSRARFELDEPATLENLSVQAAEGVSVYAVTLVDTRTGDFMQLTPEPWRRLLSSDIKLYENTDVMNRAFLVGDVRTVPDTYMGSEEALAQMRDGWFDPAQTVILSTLTPQPPLPQDEGEQMPLEPDSQAVTITRYEPERVEIKVSSAAEAYLVLTDAYYPGWRATVNGEAATVERADVMFRAVRVPAGESTVIFEFKPSWWPGIALVGGAAWVAVLAALGGLWWKNSSPPPNPLPASQGGE